MHHDPPPYFFAEPLRTNQSIVCFLNGDTLPHEKFLRGYSHTWPYMEISDFGWFQILAIEFCFRDEHSWAWRDGKAIPAFLTVFGIIRNQPLGGSIQVWTNLKQKSAVFLLANFGFDDFDDWLVLKICCQNLSFFLKKFLGQMDKPLTRWFESSRTSQVWKMKVETHSDWTWEINLLQNEETKHGCKHTFQDNMKIYEICRCMMMYDDVCFSSRGTLLVISGSWLDDPWWNGREMCRYSTRSKLQYSRHKL